MGEVAVTIRIMAEPGADLNYVKEGVKDLGSNNIIEKPIGFGVNMLEAIFVFDDRKGADTDKIEESIRHIKGVRSVESGDAALV
ncbi:MAG: elongation factor 1-beta [Candidatus Aenigmarchaeota archaeon]|nr:elongation factor 1-beta [Candidatus Aenigmarchaeota archaeon]MDI6722490.1 elongation factor 1-beta [Candidatus Aenigmarchaeota archaeon]